jgi:hypothetical protein
MVPGEGEFDPDDFRSTLLSPAPHATRRGIDNPIDSILSFLSFGFHETGARKPAAGHAQLRREFTTRPATRKMANSHTKDVVGVIAQAFD